MRENNVRIPVHVPVLVGVWDGGHEAHVDGGHVGRGNRIDELLHRGHLVEPEIHQCDLDPYFKSTAPDPDLTLGY